MMNRSGFEKLLFKVPEAAEILSVSRSHMYGLIGAGKVPVIRLGASVRIPRAWLEKFVAEEVARWEKARGEQ